MDRALTHHRTERFDSSRSYEQFLATDAASRKAAGAYYTPEPLVDYVVEHTLGPLLAGKGPGSIAQLRILDPASGTGAFLLGAYRFLSSWYEQASADPDEPDGRSPRRVKAFRRHLVRHCLFGVDCDAAAVRLTRTLLAGAAGELASDLSTTIRQGNALAGVDCPDEHAGAMEWQRDFPGDFDAVLGNPPWGQKAIRVSDSMKRYLRERFPSTAGIFDLFRPFVELGVA